MDRSYIIVSERETEEGVQLCYQTKFQTHMLKIVTQCRKNTTESYYI